jgi:HEPN domain-containing protein
MKASNKEARRWFLQSVDDYQFVKWVLREGVFFDKGCFISQQAGEKALKACLYALGKRRIIGHSLYEMADEISKHDPRYKEISSEAKRLDRFYIPTRYPNGIPGGSPFEVYDKNDLARAYEDLDKVINLCRLFLKEKGISATE